MNNDILRRIVCLLSAGDIVRLIQVSKLDNYVFSNLIKSNETSSARLGIHYPEAAKKLEGYINFKGERINLWKYRSLLCRIMDIYNLKNSGQLITIQVIEPRKEKSNEFIDHTPELSEDLLGEVYDEDILIRTPEISKDVKNISPKSMSYGEDVDMVGDNDFDYIQLLPILAISDQTNNNKIIEICQFMQSVTGKIPSATELIQSRSTDICLKRLFIEQPNFFAKYLCYCVVMTENICSTLLGWTYRDYRLIERLLLELEKIGSYDHSIRICLTILTAQGRISTVFPELIAVCKFLFEFLLERRISIDTNLLKNETVKDPMLKELVQRITTEHYNTEGYPERYSKFKEYHLDDSYQLIHYSIEQLSGKNIAIRIGADEDSEKIMSYIKSLSFKDFRKVNFSTCDLLFDVKKPNKQEYFDILTNIISSSLNNGLLTRLLLDNRAKLYKVHENIINNEDLINRVNSNRGKNFIRILAGSDKPNFMPAINNTAGYIWNKLRKTKDIETISRLQSSLSRFVQFITNNNMASEILKQSIKDGDTLVVLNIISNKRVTFSDDISEEAYYLAALNDNEEIAMNITRSLSNNSQFNINGDNNAALFTAVETNKPGLVRLLIEKGSNPIRFIDELILSAVRIRNVKEDQVIFMLETLITPLNSNEVMKRLRSDPDALEDIISIAKSKKYHGVVKYLSKYR